MSQIAGAALVAAGVTLTIAAACASSDVEPYMDEVFHIPQAQRYCAARLTEWDPKITTLPGLYLLSAAVLGPIGACTTVALRLVNLVLWVATGPIAYAAARGAARASNDDAGWTAVGLMFNPLLWFFAFLYYTDVGATLSVLALVALPRRTTGWRAQAAATALGLVAVMFRQTNAVWVAYAWALRLLAQLELRWHAQVSSRARDDDAPAQAAAPLSAVLMLVLRHGPRAALQDAGFGVVLIAFAVFLIVNGGVVVGDRAAHAPVVHAVMPFYCVAIAAAFNCERAALAVLRWLTRRESIGLILRPLVTLPSLAALAVLSAAAAAAAHWGTFAHPYLLADNRHYTFFVWARTFARYGWFRYAMAPGYALATVALSRSCWLAARTRDGFALARLGGFAACVALALVPTALLEPRYFLLPIVLARVTLLPMDAATAQLAMARDLCVCAALMWVFCMRPFAWPDGSIARFMW